MTNVIFKYGMTALVLAATATVGLAQERYELGDAGFEQVERPGLTGADAELQAIRRALAAGDHDDAEDMATDWIKAHPRHPGVPEAYLLRADAKTADEDYYEALFDYEFLARNFPESKHFHTALEREFDIAQIFANGLNRKVLGMRLIPATIEAEELMIRIQERAPGSKLAERVAMTLADHYYDQADMYLAAEAYGIFIQNFPRSPWVERARVRQIEANLATFKGPSYDATGLIEARARLGALEAIDPVAGERIGAAELTVRIDESLAQKQLIVGRWYEGQDKLVSAKVIYRGILKDYPESAAAYDAQQRLHELDPRQYAAPTAPVAPAAQPTDPAPATPEVSAASAAVPVVAPVEAPADPVTPDAEVPDESDVRPISAGS